VTAPPASALDGPVEQVAPTLLGGLLRHGDVAVRLTEVEAYGGATDPASHAFRGPTARTEVMFGPPGRLYVYFSYGMHWAMNVVCGPDGTASGVLLRAGEVVEGVDVARSRRGRATDRDLARGPGRLAQALGVAAEHKGTSLLGGGPLSLELDPQPAGAISTGPRVGVSVEVERPWRFWLTGSRFVSDYKRSPRAPASAP
jgi:DNA-3-methyladenine glycosylase